MSAIKRQMTRAKYGVVASFLPEIGELVTIDYGCTRVEAQIESLSHDDRQNYVKFKAHGVTVQCPFELA